MGTLARVTATTRRLLDAVLIVLILVVVFGVILAKVVPLTGRQTIIVGGRSMEPAIAMGSAIVITPVSGSELRVGDVVSLRAGEDKALFTHRIVSIDERSSGIWVHTRGDANASPDPSPIPAKDVEGRVDASIPLAGYLIALLSIPTGVLFLIGLAATLLAAVWLLESLELDQVDRIRVELPQDAAPRLGEPISTRALAVDSGFGSGPLTVAEQIARSRAVRGQQARWQAAAQERVDRTQD
jgi:signal peptidase